MNPRDRLRLDGFQDFYRRRNERALLGIIHGSEYPLHRYPASAKLPESRPLTPDDLDLPGYLRDGDALWQRHEATGDDTFWSASIFWGVPWVEAVIGCPLRVNHRTGSIHTEVPPGFDGAASLPKVDDSNPWMRALRHHARRLGEHAAGRYPLATTRMRGISDLLAALYGGQELIFAMMEKPDEVRATADRLGEIWIQVARAQLEAYPLFEGGHGAYLYNLWTPAGTAFYQDDSVALLSPDLFEEFILPVAKKIASELPCLMHLHPTGFLPWQRWLELPFVAVELHIDHGGPSAKKLEPIHRAILERKPLVVWGELGDEDLADVLRLPPGGLLVSVLARDPARAVRAMEIAGRGALSSAR